MTVLWIGGITPTPAADTNAAILVGNQSMDRSTINEQISQQMQQMKRRFGKQLKKKPKMEKKLRQRVKKQVIDQVVQKLVLLEHAHNSDITVSSDEINERYSKFKKKIGKKSFNKKMKKSGESEQDLKQKIKENLKIKKFIDQNTESVSVSEEDARSFYKKNSKRMKKRSFKDVKGKIISMLKNRKKNKKVKELVANLKENTEIKIRI